VKAFLLFAAMLAALLLQSVLTQIAPPQARLFDPFLIVVVYCGLAFGETYGMLAGMLAGWIQDVHFGGTVVGLSALSKILIGFSVGVAGGRLLVSGPAQRLLILFAATLMDALLFERLASVFELNMAELSLTGLLGRATVNAIVGAGLFELLERRVRHVVRP
jgi:rod shape-determining protein MreD